MKPKSLPSLFFISAILLNLKEQDLEFKPLVIEEFVPPPPPAPVQEIKLSLTDFEAPAFYNFDREPLRPCYIKSSKRKMPKMRKKRLRY